LIKRKKDPISRSYILRKIYKTRGDSMLAEEIKNYENIFHSYRSGDKTIQSENNVTKAFINVFQHSHEKLIRAFLRKELQIEDEFIEGKYNFDLQRRKPFEIKFNKAIVIGIAEKKPYKSEIVEVDKTGVPDAIILSKNSKLCVLIEVKLGSNLNLEQIKRHENLFIEGQMPSSPHLITWDQVIDFMKMEQMELKGNEFAVTRFLIEQFVSYCYLNGLGSHKSVNYYIESFPGEKKVLVRELHNYILGKFGNALDPNKKARSNGISYTRKGARGGFFAKIESRMKGLILSFGVKSVGKEVQNELNKLGIGKKRSTKYSGFNPEDEAWIDLMNDKVDIEMLKPLIDKAFDEKR
jgi:hypothetical protein